MLEHLSELPCLRTKLVWSPQSWITLTLTVTLISTHHLTLNLTFSPSSVRATMTKTHWWARFFRDPVVLASAYSGLELCLVLVEG